MKKESGEISEEAIAASTSAILRVCNLIPIANWGFDEAVLEKLEQRKNSIINQRLSKNERKALSQESKNRIARASGVSVRTVGDVLQWMASSSAISGTVNPKKRTDPEPLAVKPQKPQQHVKKTTPKLEKPAPKPVIRKAEAAKESSSDSGSDFEDKEVMPAQNNNNNSKKENGKPKPASTRKPQQPVLKRQNSSDSASTVKKQKLEESSESGDEKNPIEARQLALKRLHQRIEELKKNRCGKMTPEVYQAKMKLKRRLGKLKAKESKRKAKEEAAKTNGEAPVPPPNKKPKLETGVRTDDGRVVYSKFDFIVKKDEPEKKLSKKEKRDKFTGRDYARLLEKAEKRGERIEAVREKNPEKAAKIEENIKWNKVLNLAEGQKVKDDVELLRKSAKRKEKLKQKKKEKWDKRVESVEEKKRRKQEKRETNIQARKDTVKKKKLERARKKGRIL